MMCTKRWDLEEEGRKFVGCQRECCDGVDWLWRYSGMVPLKSSFRLDHISISQLEGGLGAA